MRQLIALFRGLVHRAGSTVMIFVVASVAAAAAAAGPVYYQSSRVSILRDGLASAVTIGDGYQATLTGPVSQILPSLRSTLESQLRNDIGSAAVGRMFAPAVESLEGNGTDSDQDPFTLAWRTDYCAHLVIRGRCPSSPGEVIISRSDVPITGWHVGSRISGTGWPTLTVTGVYQAPRLTDSYWAPRAQDYFALELPPNFRAAAKLDALLTPAATLAAAPVAVQGTAVVNDELAVRRLQVADVAPLRRGLGALTTSTYLTSQNIVFESTTPATLAAVQSGWRSVAVPVTLTTLTVLLLSWLLLFLTVTDAIEARGPEVALARLRGHGRRGVVIFGLSEPAFLLLVALPSGAVAGWAGAGWLARSLLLPGTPVMLPWTAWAAAAAATAGGLAAVLLAARRTLVRGVVLQLRRSGRTAASRGWVTDAFLLAASGAGLLDLLTTGQIGSASHGVVNLLVPGLLGLAVAVVASRLLPLACRALYGMTSRHGGLAAFLAFRHIARRPGGVRTTIVLATAFSLAAFAFAAWSTGQRNYQSVAGPTVGAPVVLSVLTPTGHDLGAIVAKADPSGRRAATVETYLGTTGPSVGEVTLAVDSARFARVASWPRQVSAQEAAALTARLRPHTPPAIVLTGDAMRLVVDVRSLSQAGEQIYANVTTGATPVTLGTLPRHGTVTLSGGLVGCPCVLQSLALTLSGQQIQQGARLSSVTGSLTVKAIEVHAQGRWRPVAASALAVAGAWRDPTAVHPAISGGPGGLTWSFANVSGRIDPTLASGSLPARIPALVAAPIFSGDRYSFTGTGIDGHALAMHAVAVLPAIPGAPGNGVIVDRQVAELAAGGNLSLVSQQVWLAAGALPLIKPRLIAAGVKITSEQKVATLVARLQRQGPALASVLFLADAVVAAILAAGAAVLGLYVSARRRRYEYAALEASGVKRRSLRSAVLLELAVVLGFGTATGVATGLAAATVVLRSVPEFVGKPPVPDLSFVPPTAPVAAMLGAAIGLLAVAALISSVTLIRGVSADQLREAPTT